MTTDRYRLHDLHGFAVGEWAGAEDREPIVCVHGVSSTHRLFSWLADAVPERRIVAPDLRGRGGSVDVGGPYGLDTHAADVLHAMHALGIERATLVGMSLGGFIAAVIAAVEPARVSTLVLVDGGLPMRPPVPDLQRDQLPVVLASRIERTKAPYESVTAYADFFLGTLGLLLDRDDPVLHDYLAYDLRDDLRVRLDPEALLRDSEDVYFGDAIEPTLDRVSVPTRLLRAEWSIGEGTPGAYDEALVDSWRPRVGDLTARLVPGTDHASIVMTARGAAAIAEEIAAGERR